jgi:hypothetical protein
VCICWGVGVLRVLGLGQAVAQRLGVEDVEALRAEVSVGSLPHMPGETAGAGG